MAGWVDGDLVDATERRPRRRGVADDSARLRRWPGALSMSRAANEIAFLDRILDQGEIEPGLLTTDDEMADRIRIHPLLEWKAVNARKHRKG